MIKFNEVTWYSRLAAIVVFIGGLPILAFYIGMSYQKTLEASAVGTYTQAVQTATAPTQSNTNLGTYKYMCDEHVSFVATFASDMKHVLVNAADGGVYPPQTVLQQKEVTSGVRYEGNDIVFVGKGESVILNEGDESLNCSPVQVQDEAPMNFGD